MEELEAKCRGDPQQCNSSLALHLQTSLQFAPLSWALRFLNCGPIWVEGVAQCWIRTWLCLSPDEWPSMKIGMCDKVKSLPDWVCEAMVFVGRWVCGRFGHSPHGTQLGRQCPSPDQTKCAKCLHHKGQHQPVKTKLLASSYWKLQTCRNCSAFFFDMGFSRRHGLNINL